MIRAKFPGETERGVKPKEGVKDGTGMTAKLHARKRPPACGVSTGFNTTYVGSKPQWSLCTQI